MCVEHHIHTKGFTIPDRRGVSVKVWLQEHPEIEVISRDRAGSYADVRIVDKIRRMQKIGFAAPYSQHGDCTRQIRKVYFAALLKTEGMSRRDLAGCTHTSKLNISPDHG